MIWGDEHQEETACHYCGILVPVYGGGPEVCDECGHDEPECDACGEAHRHCDCEGGPQ